MSTHGHARNKYAQLERSSIADIFNTRRIAGIVNYDEVGDGRLDNDKIELLTNKKIPRFEAPLKPIGASGGTAAFFSVKYKPGEELTDQLWDGKPVGSSNYWVGKDFARAKDEVDFYETAKLLLGQPEWAILNWVLPYGGILRSLCEVGGESEFSLPKTAERDIILMRNALDGFSKPRLLDIKLGEVTAVAGWQGKSAFGTWKQKWIDGATNSAGEVRQLGVV